MDLIWEGVREAGRLIGSGDPLVLDAAWRSLWISCLAVGLAALLGLPLGSGLARLSFPGRRVVVTAFRAAMAFPTVFVGLVCFALFSRRGPLSSMDLLYTPWAIVIGELVLALPIVASVSHGAIRSLDARVAETAMTLGAGPLRRWWTYLSEARTGVILGLLMSFARCVTELGIAMMVGGNIKHRTRTLATATALETGKGEFSRGMAMGLILLFIALLVTVGIALVGREERRGRR